MAENLLHGVPAKSLSPRAFGWQLALGWLFINLSVCGLIAAFLVNSQRHFEDAARQSAETLVQVLEGDIAASLEKVDTLLLVSVDEFQRQHGSGCAAGRARSGNWRRGNSRMPPWRSFSNASVRGKS